jgi:hypothetical protein
MIYIIPASAKSNPDIAARPCTVQASGLAVLQLMICKAATSSIQYY